MRQTPGTAIVPEHIDLPSVVQNEVVVVSITGGDVATVEALERYMQEAKASTLLQLQTRAPEQVTCPFPLYRCTYMHSSIVVTTNEFHTAGMRLESTTSFPRLLPTFIHLEGPI